MYKQKMKHLLCEHRNTTLELKAAGLVSAEVMHKEQEQLESELHKAMRATVVDMQVLDIENLVTELELVRSTLHPFYFYTKGLNVSLLPDIFQQVEHQCYKHHFACYVNRNMMKK